MHFLLPITTYYSNVTPQLLLIAPETIAPRSKKKHLQLSSAKTDESAFKIKAELFMDGIRYHM